MQLDIGGADREATSTSSHVAFMTAVWFSYMVGADDLDTDGLTVKANSITGTGTWRTHNPIRNIGRNHAALSNQAAHKVDGRQWGAGLAGVDAVALGSPAVGDTFERGEVIEATVTFNRAVTVTGTPRLALNIGSNTRQASYASGSGTTALKFRYTAVQADVDSNGITIGASALTLSGGDDRRDGHHDERAAGARQPRDHEQARATRWTARR